MKKQLLLYGFFWFLFWGCQSSANYSISGTWKDADGEVVRLINGWGCNPEEVLDSAVVCDGHFKLIGKLDSLKRCMLSVG